MQKSKIDTFWTGGDGPSLFPVWIVDESNYVEALENALAILMMGPTYLEDEDNLVQATQLITASLEVINTININNEVTNIINKKKRSH